MGMRRLTWPILCRCLVLALLAGLLAAAPKLDARLAVEGVALRRTGWVAIALAAVALLRASWVAPDLLAAWGRALAQRPVRAALLVLGAGALGLIALAVATEWGAVAALACGGLLLLALTCPRGRIAARAHRFVAVSPLPLASVAVLFGLGELWLRMHPEQVAGGTGGNPALRELYRGLYHYNSFDLRDREFPRAKPPGEVRVLALGDSFTFGQGVAGKDTYCDRMEALHQAAGSGTALEVINAGCRGVNTAWEYAYLVQKGLAFDPDLVTVQFYANDIVIDQAEHGAAEEAPLGAFTRLKRWVLKSYFVYFLRHRFDHLCHVLHAWRDPGVPADYLWAVWQRIERDLPEWRGFCATVDRFAALSRERSLPVVFLVLPHPGPPHAAAERINRTVLERCRAAGLRVLDCTDAVAAIDPARQAANSFDDHPGPEYHARVAEHVLAALREWRLLP